MCVIAVTNYFANVHPEIVNRYKGELSNVKIFEFRKIELFLQDLFF